MLTILTKGFKRQTVGLITLADDIDDKFKRVVARMGIVARKHAHTTRNECEILTPGRTGKD
jgi:hypothetical protein